MKTEKAYLAYQGSPELLLTYFQWQFLIRSDQYETFYQSRDIAFLINENARLSKELDTLFSEISEVEHTHANISYMMPDDFEEGQMEESELDNWRSNKTDDLEVRKEELEKEIESLSKKQRRMDKKCSLIREEAEKMFKLRTHHFRDLKPEKERLPDGVRFIGIEMPLFGLNPKRFRKMSKEEMHFYASCIQQITHVDELQEKIKFSTPRLNPGGRLREIIFSVDTRYPQPFLVKVFSEKLKKVILQKNIAKKAQEGEKVRIKRKEWDQWHEALEVYDFLEAVKRNYRGKDHLLETARLMGKKHPEDQYWRNGNPQSSDRVRKKYDAARKLIHSAGEGELVASIR